MKNEFIYHVITKEEWERVADSQFYAPESLNKEGFRHFSFMEQIPGVIDRFCRDQKSLIVLKVNINKIKSRLVFETVADIGIFPHLYGTLNIDSVVGVLPICIDDNNKIFWTE